MKTESTSSLSNPSSGHIPHNLTADEKRRIAFEICDRISGGEFLTVICEEDGMPHPNTLRNWCQNDPGIAEAYSVAQHGRIDAFLATIMRTVVTPLPQIKDARGNVRIDPAAVAQMRIQIETMRWMVNVLKAQLHGPEPSFSSRPENQATPVTSARNLNAPSMHKNPFEDMDEAQLMQAMAKHLEEVEAFEAIRTSDSEHKPALYAQKVASAHESGSTGRPQKVPSPLKTPTTHNLP